MVKKNPKPDRRTVLKALGSADVGLSPTNIATGRVGDGDNATTKIDEHGGKFPRRAVLRSAGILSAGMTAGIPSIVSADEDREVSEFRVRGRKTTQVTYQPDEITVTTRKQSSDLKRRYDIDPPVLEKEKTFGRSGAEDDSLPKKGADTFVDDWDTYLATENEWRELANGEVSIRDSHQWQENLGTYAAWIYERESCTRCIPTYEITSPINVIFDLPYRDQLDVSYVLNDAGWTHPMDCEYTRYAWNSNKDQFEAHHNSRATTQCGVWDNRHHVRYWEFGDYVSMQGHYDKRTTHEVLSYWQTESEIRSIFNDAGWNVGGTREYNLYNEKDDPWHSGYASEITRW